MHACREYIAEDTKRFQAAQTTFGDRAPGHRPQFGERTRAVQRWRVEPHTVDGVTHDCLRQHLGSCVVLVHQPSRSVVRVEKFATRIALLAIAVQHVAKNDRDSRGTHDGNDREQQQSHEDRDGARHEVSLLASGLRLECPCLDLDRATGGQGRNTHSAARRAMVAKASDVRLVELGEGAHVGEEAKCLGDVGERCIHSC